MAIPREQPEPPSVARADCSSFSVPPLAVPATLDLRQDVAASTAKLMPYQRQGVAFGLAAEGRLLLADEMGLGKTAQAIILAAHFADEWPLLVLCPASMRYVWAEELERWLPNGLAPAVVHLCEGRAFELPSPCPAVVVATYSLFVGQTALVQSVAATRFKVVVADESHYLRNPQSKRSKELGPVMQQARRLILLSGTPALARPVELYSQLTALAPREFGSYTAFTTRYCEGHRGRFGWEAKGASNVAELHERIAPMMLRRRKAAVLTQLPPKRRQLVRIDIAAASRAGMRAKMGEMEHLKASAEDLVEDRPNRTVSFEARRAIMDAWKMTGEAKAEMVAMYLMDLLHGSDDSNKVLVFAHHATVMDALSTAVARAGCGFIRIDGGVPPAERVQLVSQFQNRSDIRVAILSVTAAGQGLTLTAASTVLFAELHWTPGVLQQAEDRAHRMGQHSAVQVLYLVCFDTAESVDLGLWRALARKSGVVGQALEGKRGDWRAEGDRHGKELPRQASGSEVNAAADDSDDLRCFFSGIAAQGAKRRRATDADPLSKLPRGDLRRMLAGPVPSVLVCNSDSEGEGSSAAKCSTIGRPPTPNGANKSEGPSSEQCALSLSGPFESRIQFSVSPHTSRVMLHDGESGAPLGIFFHVATLELGEEESLDEQVLMFVREWRRLRPPEQRELCGRLLSPPLHAALTALRNARDRGVAVEEGQCFQRYRAGKVVDNSVTASGTCGWCKKDIQAVSLPKGPRSALSQQFCSRECSVEFQIRGAFQSSAVRREIFSVEHGICQLCGVDTYALFQRVLALTPPERFQVLLKTRYKAAGAVLTKPKEEHFWQADHILAVAEGGGQCPLGNFRTLCTPCHAGETKRLHGRLAAQKRSFAAEGSRSLLDVLSTVPQNLAPEFTDDAAADVSLIEASQAAAVGTDQSSSASRAKVEDLDVAQSVVDLHGPTQTHLQVCMDRTARVLAEEGGQDRAAQEILREFEEAMSESKKSHVDLQGSISIGASVRVAGDQTIRLERGTRKRWVDVSPGDQSESIDSNDSVAFLHTTHGRDSAGAAEARGVGSKGACVQQLHSKASPSALGGEHDSGLGIKRRRMDHLPLQSGDELPS